MSTPAINHSTRKIPLRVTALLWLLFLPGMGQTNDAPLLEQDIRELFPKATVIGEFLGSPPVWPVYQLQELLGYAFESRHLVEYSGFSGDPINLLIGIDAEGRFTGVKLLQQHEPIFLHGLGPQPLLDYLTQYTGVRLSDRIVLKKSESRSPGNASGTVFFDAVTKATVSIIVVNDTALAAALKVARQTLEDFAQGAPAEVRHDLFEVLDWTALRERELVRHWLLTREDIESALGNSLSDYPDSEWTEQADSATTEVYFAYLNAPNVGRNLLGATEYKRLQQKLNKGESAVLVMSNGFYDVIGDDFKPGTIPERFALLQNGLPIPLRDINFYNYNDPVLIEGAPVFENVRIFRIRASSGFDPSAAMDLQINFDLRKNHLIRDQGEVNTSYQLPARFFRKVESAPESKRSPLWLRIWQQRWIEIATLCFGLLMITTLFIRQQQMMASIRNYYLIRWSLLLYTLFFIGFYTQGQLSVVNIFTLLAEVIKGFDIGVFLLDPIIFVLWSFTFITLFIWGRGVFCGWLCPFGAMQEMVAWIAQRLRLKQWKLGDTVHKRLLKLKYIILAALTLISLYSLNQAMVLSEIEPFKTAITLTFIREWPFVLYALLVLGAGLFINKFYCRYLCPLGAGLALLGKLRLVEMIRRRRECGSRCQMCRNRCQVDAIGVDGQIDYNECVQCLECVAIINDPKQCAIDLLELKQSGRQGVMAVPVTAL